MKLLTKLISSVGWLLSCPRVKLTNLFEIGTVKPDFDSDLRGEDMSECVLSQKMDASDQICHYVALSNILFHSRKWELYLNCVL